MGSFLSEPVAAIVVERSSGPCLQSATASMQGWRKNHEDAHLMQASCGAGVFAVLDGHGGQACAHIGQGFLREQLVRFSQQGTVSQDVAQRVLVEAFVEVDVQCRKNLKDGDRSGSTVVSAIITQPQPEDFCVQLAHAGDSRAVLCTRGGKRLVCTSDHKPEREDETRRIVAAGGSVAQGPLGGGPMRVDGALAVSRSLGDFHFKPQNMSPEACKVTAVPEVQTVTNCAPGDWLLLACDGVFDVMENEDVNEFIGSRLAKAPPGTVDGGVIVVELLQHCLGKGSKDNCTACLVQILANTGSNEPPTYRRELLQGPWQKAAPDVKAKYAEFFAEAGFEEEARKVRESAASAPSAAAGASGASTQGSSPSPAVTGATLVKALQAMRSARGIQSAWRERQAKSANNEGGEGAGRGSGAGKS